MKKLFDMLFGTEMEEPRIVLLAGGILVFITLVTGAVVFYAVAEPFGHELEKSIVRTLNDRERLFTSELEDRVEDARVATALPHLTHLMKQAVITGMDDTLRLEAEGILTSQRLAGLTLLDAQGQPLLSLGKFVAQPEVAVALRSFAGATLRWKGGYYLNIDAPIRDEGRLLGTLRMELPLKMMSAMATDFRGLGESGEMVVCAALGRESIQCFPSRHQPQGFRAPRLHDTQPLPISIALDGRSGFLVTRDYRGKKVFDAYKPIGHTGLAMVVKIDTAEMESPIRRSLWAGAGVLALLVILGTWLLRWQVGPLVRQVISSRDRVHAILDNVADGLITIDERGIIESFNISATEIFGYSSFETVEKNASILMLKSSLSKHGEAMQDYLCPGVPKVAGRHAREVQGQRKDGSIFPLELTLGEMVLNGKRLFIVSARDISELKAAEENLRLWARAIESSINAIFMVDARQENFPVFYVNPAFERTTGYSSKEVVGKSCRLLDSGDLNQPQIEEIYQAIRGQHDGSAVLRGYRKDGSLFWFELFFSPVHDESGKVTHFVGVLNDITERKRTEEALRMSRDLLLSVVETAPVRIFWKDRDSRYLGCNTAFAQDAGFSSPDELIGKTDFDMGWKDQAELYRGGDKATMESGSPKLNYEEPQTAPHGNMIWLSTSKVPLRDESHTVIGILGIYQDITERKHYESQLERQTNFDELTGLANRNLLLDRLNQALAFSHRHDCGLAVLFIDLDHFKNINDSLGHDAGDALLTQVASRLAGNVREGDTVARQGGDEFVLLLPEIREEDDVAEITQKLLQAMSAPFDVGGHELHITCSIGIASYPKDGEDNQTLLKNADAAMYRAKEMGRNNAQYYAAEMNVRAMERLVLENSLHHALERNEFLLHYQPQVDLRSGEIVGMEALVRWEHPELGLISPARFIPVAEESGLIMPLGEWVLRTACAQNKAWQRAGLKPISVAVNLSARQFRQPNLVEVVAGILRETGLDPTHLDLEVTESLVMQNVEATIATLGRLKAMGVKLSIDDFGTGYSSLNYLKRFPIHTLKIDQSFVRDVTTDPSDAAIAKTIISMAHELGLTVIAEGVETEEQQSFLRLRRCDEMQGYFFSRPVPAAEFENLLREGRCLQNDEAAADLSQRTLLLLDDEENILTSLTRLLRPDGYKILKATSAAAALDLLAQNPVGVIISDQRMPEMSGVEFLRRVKQIYPDTVRMVLSGYTDLKSVTDAINEGAVYKFLTKPWDDELLRTNIQEAFQRYELVRDNQRLSEEMTLINEELNQAKRELEKRVEQKTGEARQNIGVLQISQEMLEYLPVGVIGVGEDGLIAVANYKANEMFDADRLPLVGSLAAERLPSVMIECLAKGGERHAYQFENGRNVIFWCRSMSAVSVSAGRVLVIVPNGQDGD